MANSAFVKMEALSLENQEPYNQNILGLLHPQERVDKLCGLVGIKLGLKHANECYCLKKKWKNKTENVLYQEPQPTVMASYYFQITVSVEVCSCNLLREIAENSFIWETNYLIIFCFSSSSGTRGESQRLRIFPFAVRKMHASVIQWNNVQMLNRK